MAPLLSTYNFLLRIVQLLRLLVTCKNLGLFFNPFLVFPLMDKESFHLNTKVFATVVWNLSWPFNGFGTPHGISADISVAYARDIGGYPWLLYSGHMPWISADILGPLPRIKD